MTIRFPDGGGAGVETGGCNFSCEAGTGGICRSATERGCSEDCRASIGGVGAATGDASDSEYGLSLPAAPPVASWCFQGSMEHPEVSDSAATAIMLNSRILRTLALFSTVPANF